MPEVPADNSHTRQRKSATCALRPESTARSHNGPFRGRGQAASWHHDVMPKNLTIRLDDEFAADTEALADVIAIAQAVTGLDSVNDLGSAVPTVGLLRCRCLVSAAS